MESIFTFIIIGISCFVLGAVIAGCIAYRKGINEDVLAEKQLQKPKSYEISMEQLQDWIDGGLNKDKPLEDQFMEWLSMIPHSPTLLETADSDVECVAECKGSDCPCSPAREDCCPDPSSGKCKVVININKLCGIEDYERNPKLLTVKEAEILANTLAKYFSQQDR